MQSGTALSALAETAVTDWCVTGPVVQTAGSLKFFMEGQSRQWAGFLALKTMRGNTLACHRANRTA